MRKSLSLIFCSLLIALCLCFAQNASAEDLEMINRPVNTSGLTGLLFTTVPYALPLKSVEIGVAALSENSTVPNYTVNELPAISVTLGIAQDMEISLKGSYFHKTLNGGNIEERGAGDTILSYKWNFIPSAESSPFPAVAMIVTGIAPTSNRDLNLGGVTHWGAKFGFSAGSEIIWGDHVLGLYADAQMAVQDLSDVRYRDKYGILNAGLLLPISKYRNLQMLLEYTLVNGIDKMTSAGGDYSGVTYGLRVVSETFNLTIGTQFLRKEPSGFDDSSRVTGMMSVKL